MFNYKLSDYKDDLQKIGVTSEIDMTVIMDYLYTLAGIGAEYLKIKKNSNIKDE